MPAVNLLAVNIGWLISGTVVIESLFAIPGIGQLLVRSIFTRDYMVVQGVAMVLACATVLIDFVADVVTRGPRPTGEDAMSSRPLIAPWRLRLRFGFSQWPADRCVGLLILLLWFVLALLAPWIAPYDPIAQNTDFSLLGPSWAHPFGTDNYGRDILSRVIWGARIDLQLAIVGVIFPFMIGTFVGAVSGYIGGRFDSFCMRVIDVILAFPFLVLMLAIMAILGPGLKSFYIAMALVGWVSYARLIRSQILVLKESDFALAAKSLGFGSWAHSVPASATECDVWLDCVFHVGRGTGAAQRCGRELPGAGRATAHCRVGDDGRRRAGVHHHRLVDLHVPRPGHRHLGHGFQPAGRWCRASVGRSFMSLLQVQDLSVIANNAGRDVTLVDRVSFELAEGEILGLVGESGSGKTMACRGLMRLLPSPNLRVQGGAVRLAGQELVAVWTMPACALCAVGNWA